MTPANAHCTSITESKHNNEIPHREFKMSILRIIKKLKEDSNKQVSIVRKSF
jgi:hypothetical protein